MNTDETQDQVALREAIEKAYDEENPVQEQARDNASPGVEASADSTTTTPTPESISTQEAPAQTEDPIDKRFRGMQSLYDRKLNEQTQQIAKLTEAITILLSPRQATPEQPPEDFQEVLASPAKVEQYIRGIVKDTLQKDPPLPPEAAARLELQTEIQAYRSDPENGWRPDYDPFVGDVAEEFQQMNLPINRKTLKAALAINRRIIARIAEMASRQSPAAGEAAAAQRSAPQPNNGRIVTQDARAALQNQARTLQPQGGVSLGGAPVRHPKDEREAVAMAMEQLGWSE